MFRTGLAVTLALSAALVGAPAASAACPPQTREQYDRAAKVVVKGKFLNGSTGSNGRLISPAPFRVTKYIKGDGHKEITVDTAPVDVVEGPTSIELRISPKPGERWRLPGRFAKSGVFKSTTCDGATRLH
jgi:hypothetical protein